MIKGNERRVVVVKGERDSPYELACLFMRDGRYEEKGDIVKDAERIIRNAIFETVNDVTERDKKVEKRERLIFIGGIFVRAAISFVVYAIIVFGFGYGL